MNRAEPVNTSNRSVVVVGAGGVIGSHLVGHLGRMGMITAVTLIDREVYEEKNLLSQELLPDEVGKEKALVQARKLRRLKPSLRVEAIADSVQNVPMSKLREEVILTGLDSREARQYVNQVAWRLGLPWIDAGVEGAGLLARMSVYLPGRDAPCLECAWDERHYEALEQAYPCLGGSAEAVPTNSPSSLGALAASLQALECRKLLSGELDGAAAGREVVIDARNHRHYLTTFRRNQRCRFDHESWDIEELSARPSELRLQQAFELGRQRLSGKGPLWLRVEGRVFVDKLVCPCCGGRRSLLQLRHCLTARRKVCRKCGSAMTAAGLGLLDTLEEGHLSPGVLKRSLQAVGFRPGDVFTVGRAGSEVHFELGVREAKKR